MISIILLIPSLIVLFVLLFTYIGQGKLNNGILFGITLPKKALEHKGIKELQTSYSKTYWKYFTLLLVLYTPIFFLQELIAFQFIYYFAWLGLTIALLTIPFRKAFKTALKLKRENDWFVGEKRVVHSDIKLAQLKQSMHISSWWYVIPIALSAAGIITAVITNDPILRSAGLASLFMTIIMLGLSIMFGRSKAKIYSKNSNINIAINRTARKYWSILWLGLAVFEVLNAGVAYLLLTSNLQVSLTAWISDVIFVALIPLAGILFVHHKVKAVESSILELDKEVIYTDDDEYWANGISYHNPNDKSIFVPKRIGIGTTVNTATFAGKAIFYGSLVVAAVVILGACFMLIRSEYTSPELTLQDNGTVIIDYPMYNYEFQLSEVEKLQLVEKIPSGFKSNGEATSKYARGNFKLDEYGKSKLYIFKNNPPYIVMKLADLYVIYNDKDPMVTKQLYEKMQSRID